ncbi:Thioredoxin [Penicillium rolfsii]|nr:Thioredoxin [Penicillium rolfsii]
MYQRLQLPLLFPFPSLPAQLPPAPPAHHSPSKKDFLTKILDDKSGPVILDAWAEWCGPCLAIAPKVEEFSNKYPQAKFYKVDVDKVDDVAQELGIRAMPTILFFNNGEKITEVVGAQPHAIEKEIEALLAV